MSLDDEPEPVEVYVDERGRTVRRFSPGYADGAAPQRSVRGLVTQLETPDEDE